MNKTEQGKAANACVEYNPKRGVYTIGDKVDSFISMGFNVTHMCNSRCRFCCDYDPNNGKAPHMPLDDANLIVGKIIESGVKRVSLTGGEPLLHPHLISILKSLKEGGVSTALTTNLTLLNHSLIGYHADAILPVVDNIKTSIYGSEEVHDTLTGRRGSYSRTIDAIRGLISLGVPVFVQSVVLKENKDLLLDVAREAERIGVSRLALYSLINQGRARDIFNEGENVSEEEGESIFEEIKKKKVEEGWSLDLAFIRWGGKGHYIIILPDGRVTANPVADNPPENNLVVGNLLEDSVQKLWEKYPFKEAHIEFYRAH